MSTQNNETTDFLNPYHELNNSLKTLIDRFNQHKKNNEEQCSNQVIFNKAIDLIVSENENDNKNEHANFAKNSAIANFLAIHEQNDKDCFTSMYALIKNFHLGFLNYISKNKVIHLNFEQELKYLEKLLASNKTDDVHEEFEQKFKHLTDSLAQHEQDDKSTYNKWHIDNVFIDLYSLRNKLNIDKAHKTLECFLAHPEEKNNEKYEDCDTSLLTFDCSTVFVGKDEQCYTDCPAQN